MRVILKFIIAVVIICFFIEPASILATIPEPLEPFFDTDEEGTVLFPQINFSLGASDDPTGVVPAMQVLFLMSLIALAPSLLVLMTGFTRIIIALFFLRQAMATQQMPPNQIVIGIALFLTIFLMTPQLNAINENALIPFGAGEISQAEAIERAMAPIRQFMLDQVHHRDLALFFDLADLDHTIVDEDIPNFVLIPAFILSELTRGFIIGFFIYLPFIVIDMVVASVLMAMGMMMLPPAMISMPFKILLFLLVGGWQLIIQWIMFTFNVRGGG